MFCTIKTKSKIAASQLKDLAPRLIKIATNKRNPSTQVFAIKVMLHCIKKCLIQTQHSQALTNICEHPVIRKDVKENHYQEVLNIQLGEEPRLKEYKEILLTIINWVPTSV